MNGCCLRRATQRYIAVGFASASSGYALHTISRLVKVTVDIAQQQQQRFRQEFITIVDELIPRNRPLVGPD